MSNMLSGHCFSSVFSLKIFFSKTSKFDSNFHGVTENKSSFLNIFNCKEALLVVKQRD